MAVGETRTTTTTTTTTRRIIIKEEEEEKKKKKNKAAVEGEGVEQRLKREDCRRTKHDSAFSKWLILIGSSDWEDHRLGKNGAERYRIANLPTLSSSSSCPGIYELGVAHVQDGRDLRKLAPHRILVVYLGQADNVRTRLQHYGRAGSHLDHHHHHHHHHHNRTSLLSLPSHRSSNNDDVQDDHRRPAFFQDVFARGFSIVFRWAPMKSKKEAEEKESLLLGVFDYAWNKIANGSCRRDDILLKLNTTLPPTNLFDALLTNLKRFQARAFDRKRVGVKVDAHKTSFSQLQYSGDDQKSDRIIKVLRTRPTLIPTRSTDEKKEDSGICGVINADGFVCSNTPLSGRKRCQEHKGKRITASKAEDTPPILRYVEKRALPEEEEKKVLVTCGVILEDGSACMKMPPKGRKRCQNHKGRRIIIPKRASESIGISR